MNIGARRNGNILICGAGIAGSALAFWLREYGFTPTLIEEAPCFRDGGYMIDIWGTGYNLLERANLLSDVRSRGYMIDRVSFVNDRGDEVSGYGGNIIYEAVGERFFSIPRGNLARVIYDALEMRVETIYRTSIDLIFNTPDGVYLNLSGNRFRRFDIVIGADGRRSRVRELVFGNKKSSKSISAIMQLLFALRDIRIALKMLT